MPTSRLLVAHRRRAPGWLDRHEDREPPALEDLRSLAGDADRLVLTGGEPTLRPDLLRLLSALDRPLTLCTDGQALTSAERLGALQDRGVDRLRVRLHSVRPACHDFLVGQAGAAKRSVTALRVARTRMATEVEITVTRSNVGFLAETVQAAVELGVSRVRLRRVRRQGPAAERFVAVSPRLGLAEPFLEEAIEAGWRAGLGVEVEGFPACALGRGASALDPSAELGAAEPLGDRCGSCDGCPGIAADYLATFGAGELLSEDDHVRVEVPVPPVDPATPPPPRVGRHPATRLRFVRQQAGRPTLAGDPNAGLAVIPGDPVVGFFLPGHSTRALRRELVELAQHRQGPLTLHDAFAHPDWLSLLRDAELLGFEVTLRGTLVEPVAEPVHRFLKRAALELLLHGPDEASHDAQVGEGSWAATHALAAALPGRLVLLPA